MSGQVLRFLLSFERRQRLLDLLVLYLDSPVNEMVGCGSFGSTYIHRRESFELAQSYLLLVGLEGSPGARLSWLVKGTGYDCSKEWGHLKSSVG